jgi:O-antigen ligase
MLLFVGSCLGYPFFHTRLGPIPVTADRVLLGLLFVAFLLYRYLGRTEIRPFDTQDKLTVVFIIVLVLSTFSHDWRADGANAAALLLFFYVMPFAFYLIVRESRLSSQVVLGVFAAAALFGLYLSVTAICETLRIWPVVFPRYIASEEYHEFFGRGRGPFLNPAANGLFLCVGLFSLLMLWFHVKRRGKLVIALLAMVHVAGVFCTLTRCVWLAAALGVFIIVMLNLTVRSRFVFAVAVAAAGSVLVAGNWDQLKAFKRDEYVSVEEMSQSATLRPILAYVAWQMFLDRPLWGCGLGQYPLESQYYLADRSTDLPLQRARGFVQHNVILSLLTETGAIGAGLFVALIACWYRSAWTLYRDRRLPPPARQFGLMVLASSCAYLTIGMFQDLTIIVMVNMLLFFLAGTMRGLRSLAPAASFPGERRGVTPSWRASWREPELTSVVA